MSDFISREAAIKLFNFAVLDCLGMEPTIRAGDIIKALESIPAADVRPVVFCRDCRHRDPEDHKCDSGEMERQGCPFPVQDDYFCAYGER